MQLPVITTTSGTVASGVLQYFVGKSFKMSASSEAALPKLKSKILDYDTNVLKDRPVNRRPGSYFVALKRQGPACLLGIIR